MRSRRIRADEPVQRIIGVERRGWNQDDFIGFLVSEADVAQGRFTRGRLGAFLMQPRNLVNNISSSHEGPMSEARRQ